METVQEQLQTKVQKKLQGKKCCDMINDSGQ